MRGLTVPQEGPSPEQIRDALSEVLSWQGLARSPQLADLLTYVVDKTLNGEGAGIKAYSIAVDVFGRPQSFDPQADPIVRVQARRLRSLLEQYYASNGSNSGVEIRLPVGRYVPEFNLRAADPEIGSDTAPSEPKGLRRFLLDASIGLAVALMAVGVAVLLRPPLPAPERLPPETPTISVSAFDNLTGDPERDADLATFRERLVSLLGNFEEIQVADKGGAVLEGTVQSTDGRFVVRATLSTEAQDGRWTQQITGGALRDGAAGLEDAAITLAAQLGNSAGPLHQAGRVWLASLSQPPPPTAYMCQLRFMSWKDRRTEEDGAQARECFQAILSATPEYAYGLAAVAGIGAWRAQYLADESTDLIAEMAGVTSMAARAVTLSPRSSFVYEQQATVLARQGSVDAALGAAERARQLNLASMDAMAMLATVLWAAGRWSEAEIASERALATIPSPPGWYYAMRGLVAFREQRFFDAIDAAQAAMQYDEELSAVIALAAAARAGRPELYERYVPLLLANRRYQQAGVMARLKLRLPVEATLERVREGLILAGVPVSVLDRPFNPDGSPREN
jgi:tetratricopeptide (TPR) repeat protein